MRSTYPILVLLVTLAAGCGGSGETNNASGTTTGTGGAGTGGATASSSTTGTGGAGTGGQGTGGTGGQGTGGAPAGTIVPVLESSDLFLNCQPIVAPDPVIGSFLAKYTNNGAFPASATITSAKLTFGTGPNSLPWAFPVTPPSGGPVQPGTTLPVNHTKQPQSGAPEGQPCGFCNDSWTLTVTWDIGGTTVTSSLPASPVQCVF